MIQLTIIKITEYGPWTLTLGSDREHELQMLQANLYGQIQKMFSEKNSLVFSNRFDEFFAVTNGLTLEDHIEFQKKLEKLSSLKLSMSIGYANTPFDANIKAYEGKKTPVILNKEHNIYGFIDGKSDQKVTIMHFDVEDLTSRRKIKSPYEISSIIFNLYAKMSQFFLERKSMTFFMGGDNFMVVSADNSKENAKEFLDLAKEEFDITLNCGIGTARTVREAVKLATKSLDTIREIRKSGKEKPEIYELSCI
ncbi:GTP cyclohydrolase IIa [Candidatus Nitrosotenuis chungbukensis]|uniref:GTP cyclohydrolase IIa n=1 Tax=Candidatus Nitrosotenuis chungbukensis TaxID=1353246 RepID=UPI0005B2B80C|nr:GTP cyclohydrolase IIa [Candidatus Nitrosotenuis chungbukensis]WKT58634.1 GTP cyclohydrolase IIa [Candidatus Nitrosotenuis chungbukensis]